MAFFAQKTQKSAKNGQKNPKHKKWKCPECGKPLCVHGISAGHAESRIIIFSSRPADLWPCAPEFRPKRVVCAEGSGYYTRLFFKS